MLNKNRNKLLKRSKQNKTKQKRQRLIRIKQIKFITEKIHRNHDPTSCRRLLRYFLFLLLHTECVWLMYLFVYSQWFPFYFCHIYNNSSTTASRIRSHLARPGSYFCRCGVACRCKCRKYHTITSNHIWYKLFEISNFSFALFLFSLHTHKHLDVNTHTHTHIEQA